MGRDQNQQQHNLDNEKANKVCSEQNSRGSRFSRCLSLSLSLDFIISEGSFKVCAKMASLPYEDWLKVACLKKHFSSIKSIIIIIAGPHPTIAPYLFEAKAREKMVSWYPIIHH